MSLAKGLVLPGAGFRVWLALVALVATLTGITTSLDPFIVLLLVWLFAACFALLSLWPIGVAIGVSLRHVRRGQRQTAAAYALVPVAAMVIAALGGWTGYRVTEWSTAQAEIRKFSHAIEVTLQTGQVVTAADRWIDPGPPTRARFLLPSMFFIRIFVVYAEGNDMAWLNDQARRCHAEGRITSLGENFYRIAGEC